MEEKNIQNLSENDQTGSDRSMQQHDAKAKYMQTDFNAQIGEADTWLDKAKTLVRQNKLAAFSALLIIFMILIAVFAPLVAPYDHLQQSLSDRLQHPSAVHWLGTDELGRDVLSRIIFGARISLTIGLVPTLISMAIGTVLGMYAGFYGGKVDFIIMRLADVMLAFPSLLLAMVVMYTMGGGLINIFIALSLVNWAGTARIVRSQTLSLKEKEYVECEKMGHHVPAHSAELYPVPDRAVYLKYPVSNLVRSILKLPGCRRAAAECQLGPDGGSRQEISVLGTLAFHRAECGYHDRGHGIQLPGGWPPGCAGSVLERAVKERRDEHE